jgi:hypothetical protein
VRRAEDDQGEGAVFQGGLHRAVVPGRQPGRSYLERFPSLVLPPTLFRILASLNHPGIVTVYNLGRTEEELSGPRRRPAAGVGGPRPAGPGRRRWRRSATTSAGRPRLSTLPAAFGWYFSTASAEAARCCSTRPRRVLTRRRRRERAESDLRQPDQYHSPAAAASRMNAAPTPRFLTASVSEVDQIIPFAGCLWNPVAFFLTS